MAKAKQAPKKRSQRPKRPSKSSSVVPTMPGRNGGVLQRGNPGNSGGGRPANEARAALLDLGLTKGVPFLAEIMDGKLAVQLVGECPSCKDVHAMPPGPLKHIVEQMQATVDQRLKALEQAWKYGLGTKDELDVSSHPEFAKQAQAYQGCVQDALNAALSTEVAQRILDDIAKRIDALTGGRRDG